MLNTYCLICLTGLFQPFCTNFVLNSFISCNKILLQAKTCKIVVKRCFPNYAIFLLGEQLYTATSWFPVQILQFDILLINYRTKHFATINQGLYE